MYNNKGKGMTHKMSDKEHKEYEEYKKGMSKGSKGKALKKKMK